MDSVRGAKTYFQETYFRGQAEQIGVTVMTRSQIRATVVHSAEAIGLSRVEDPSMRALELAMAILAFGAAALLAVLR
jgi:hypothetical protein